MMLAILVLVDCSTTSIDSSQLSAHLQRELTGSDPPGWRDPRGTGRPVEGERFTAICDDSSIRLRSESGVDLSVPFGDVAYAARARTVALAVAEHLRSAPEEEPAPKVELAENIPTPREESPWRISGSLEGGTTLKADGLLAGIGFDLTRTFGWFALHADALILGGSSDQKPLLAFIFRAAAAGEIALGDAVALDLGLRIEGGPVFGFSSGALSGIFGGGPEIGVRWAFAPPVQLQLELAAIYTTANVPLIFLAVGVAYDL